MGLALLHEDSVQASPPGKYPVQGEDLFYIVDAYDSQPFDQGRLEIHRRYLDIQYLVAGADDLVAKPVQPAALAAVLKQTLGRRAQQDQRQTA